MTREPDTPLLQDATAGRPFHPHVTVLGDGDLILTGGNHSVLSLFSAGGHPVDGSTEVFHRNMDTRRATCADLGIPLKTWVFPDKLTLFASDPAFVEHDIGSLYLRHYHRPDHADMGLHYLQDVINDPADFQQTDTHLSAKGMCKAVAAMAAALDLPGREAFVAQAAATWIADDAHCGDLGVKFDPPLTGRAHLPRRVVASQRAHNGLAAGNFGIIELIASPQASTDKTLLIFGDSFFRQNLVYLSYFFRRIVFLRARYFHEEFIAAVRPDVIFCGMAERFLSHVLDDAVRPHFLSYPYVRGCAMTPSEGFAALWSEMIDARLLR